MNEEGLVDLKQTTISSLDTSRKVSPKGIEYWLARDLQRLLDYDKWSNFKNVIEKAKMACQTVGCKPEHHFADVGKMVSIGSKAERPIDDIALSRYACYLIAMNGDPSKPVIAAAQTYFAVQTRKQELAEQRDDLESRLALRNRVKDHNKYLASAAKEAGVQSFPLFQDSGYRGLYDGLGVGEIKARKGIPDKEVLLDCMGRAELAANDFRITQTEMTLRQQAVKGDQQARETHKRVGKEVRNTISTLGGTMPENLPPEPSVKKLTSVKKRQIKELPPPSGR